MQDVQRVIPLYRFGFRIAVITAVSAFLSGWVCTQDIQGYKECETLFAAAVKAEQQNDSTGAELHYGECWELAQKYCLPKMEASACHRLAVVKAKNKKFDESARLFQRSLEIEPRNALTLCDFAQLHADRKNYSEAEEILKKALYIDPNNSKILSKLGMIIASQGFDRQDEGLQYLKQAVGEAEAHRELARIRGASSLATAPPSQQPFAASLDDPFASALRPQETNMNSVRQLESPAATVLDSTTIRTLPSQPDSAPHTVFDTPAPDYCNVSDPFPIHAVNSVAANMEEAPQLVKLSAPETSELQSPRPFLTPLFDTPQTETSSVRALQANRGSSDGAGSYERIEIANSNADSPLRPSLFGGSGLMDTGSDVSIIASLPSFAAVETKMIPHVDLGIVQGYSGNTLKESESPRLVQPNEMITPETARTTKSNETRNIDAARRARPLPVWEVSVLEPPSTVVARRDVSWSQSSDSVPEPVDVNNTPNDCRFVSVNAPDVFRFGSSQYPSTSELSAGVPVRPLTQYDSRQAARPDAVLPQITFVASDTPRTAAVNTASPDVPLMDIAARSPAEEVQQNVTETQNPAMVAAVSADPFPIIRQQPVFMNTQEPMVVTASPAHPSPVKENPAQLNMMRNIEPRPQVLSGPSNPSPQFAGAKGSEPLPRVTSESVDAVKVAEVKHPPILYPPVQEPPKTLPRKESLAGFASTRKKEAAVATSDDPAAGFSRSRK
ncbi:MAG: tetratricopeptide repeat protein [Planctomycetaceae bacterium]|nr:tetratricopeptide repeat protein [Planctomycetaceae bacterium]